MPMTKEEKEFRTSDVLRNALHALLNDPVFKRAEEIVRVTPTNLPQAQPGIHYDLTVAREYAIACGTNKAFVELKKLCEPVKQSEVDISGTNRPEFADHVDDDKEFNIFKKKE